MPCNSDLSVALGLWVSWSCRVGKFTQGTVHNWRCFQTGWLKELKDSLSARATSRIIAGGIPVQVTGSGRILDGHGHQCQQTTSVPSSRGGREQQ